MLGDGGSERWKGQRSHDRVVSRGAAVPTAAASASPGCPEA